MTGVALVATGAAATFWDLDFADLAGAVAAPTDGSVAATSMLCATLWTPDRPKAATAVVANKR